jgi:hypothetical protein
MFTAAKPVDAVTAVVRDGNDAMIARIKCDLPNGNRRERRV